MARRNPQLAREEQLKKIEGEMQRIAELAAAGGISREELTEMFRLLVLELSLIHIYYLELQRDHPGGRTEHSQQRDHLQRLHQRL